MRRTLCLPHNIVFPTRNVVDRWKTKCSSNHITSYQLKTEVNIKDQVKETANSIVDMSSVSADNTNALQLVGKFGVNGYGSHKIRHQLIDSALASAEAAHLDQEKTNSFFRSCYCPLELLADYSTLLCSRSQTALVLHVRSGVPDHLKTGMLLLLNWNLPFKSSGIFFKCELTIGGKKVYVDCKTECSMIYGKMVGLLQGDRGSFCHLCHASREEANDRC